MIGIDMELPKSCKECMFYKFRKNSPAPNYCWIAKCATNVDLKSFCPLVDLGKEDMSWEELKELAKDKIVFEHTIFKHFQIRDKQCTMSFYKGGDIYFTNKDVKYEDIKIFEDKKPFQMWQIINALTGENKCQRLIKRT